MNLVYVLLVILVTSCMSFTLMAFMIVKHKKEFVFCFAPEMCHDDDFVQRMRWLVNPVLVKEHKEEMTRLLLVSDCLDANGDSTQYWNETYLSIVRLPNYCTNEVDAFYINSWSNNTVPLHKYKEKK